ncbi:FAD-dependent oxidoreductase [Treponema sp.]|uniref:NAD(P)/FAD-dependent oxidoreductase n=1 Tax=Treponema sp. TaxID=166 RepID=UPI0025CC281E|nr:FAD-dependent oxidoreductase [Treponema sp.]MCR5217722.1 FAD-dependent oxidoreductase [Treponema sp.]
MEDVQNQIYDVAVIGTGPGGISAAITLTVRNKNVLLLGTASLSDKISKAHGVRNYPGLPEITGEDFQKKMLEHLKVLGIKITEDQVTACYSMGESFSLTCRSGKNYSAKSVIIASGVNFGKAYEGEEAFLGRGVSYCATCDAALYKGKKVAVIGQTEKEESEAAFLAETCAEVYYIPLYKKESFGFNAENIKVIEDSVLSIKGGLKVQSLLLKNQEIEVDGVFILRDSVKPSQLIPGIALDGNHIAVDRHFKTNIAGCFACGDITGTPYQYIKAAGEGNVAALSAVEYLK